jgi:hypothetical protein
MKRLLLIGFVAFIYCNNNRSTPSPVKIKNDEKISGLAFQQNNFRQKIDSLVPLAKVFIRSNGYNEEFVFIADLSMHSGIERFAIVDLEKDSVIQNGLIAHGAGGKYFSATARYSNVPGSLCSSPGKYRVGVKYNGRFGKAYKLHGLDKTNSKAFERAVVLHAYDCVPDSMTYPAYLCNSLGCPMVSYHFLGILSKYIDKSKKPVLLWIVG